MPAEIVPSCPYCGLPLRYVANRWFGHNVFDCEQCGDFPDFRSAITSAAFEAAALPPVAGGAKGLPRVLVVDDSAEQRSLYAAMLKPTAVVLTASRGEHALALAAADPPDIVILDVMMPGMDGWETCRRLKSDPVTAGIPVIMLTSLDAVDVPVRAREAGAIAVLMKPCPVDRLVLTIHAARRPAMDCEQR
jgi:CheY-like chemotaxis protein